MVRKAFASVGFLMIAAGIVMFAWPFPLFTLNEPYLSWYTESVLMVDSRPGGSGAALPFLWMITAPFGIVVAGVGIAMFSFARSPEVK